MARPTKLNDVVRNHICEELRKGQTRKAAAARVGITYKTLHAWFADGERVLNLDAAGKLDQPTDTEQQHRTFNLEVQRAEADCEDDFIGCIKRAAQHDWRAAAYWLKARRPADWNPRTAAADPEDRPFQGPIVYIPDNGRNPIPPGSDARLIDPDFDPDED